MTGARGEELFMAVACACLALGAQTVVRPSFVGGPQSNYEGRTKIAVGDAADGADFVVTSTQTGACVQAWGIHSRRFDLPPDTAGYAFEFEAVSDQDWFNPETSTAWDNAITWFDAKGARLAQRRLYPEFRKKTPARFRFCGTAPAGAVAAEVQFGIDVKPPILPGERVTVRKTTYTAYPKGTPPPRELLFDLHAPLVRSVFSSPSKDANLKVKYEVTDQTAVDWSAVAVTDAVARTAIPFTRTGDVIELAPASPWTNGIHRLEISVRDVDGNAGLSRKIFLVGEEPRPTKVALREDGVTLVEGKPFFPIGIYGIHRHAFNRNSYDRALKDLRAAGFNFAHSYVDRFSPDFLSAAARNGLGVWTFAKAAARGDPWFLGTGRFDPSVLAWYIGDDTSMNTTPQELIDHDEAVRQLDGTRITCQADGTRAVAAKSNLQDYVNGADVFMPEIYPIDGFRDERCVAEVCRDMDRCRADIRAYGDGRRPRGVWPILQCFHGCGWKRYPTVDEMYAMGFAALVHGANGITWFMYGGEITDKKEHRYSGMFRTPEDWNCMTNLARRIESLAPVLLEPTPKQPAAPEIVAGPKLDALEQPSVSLLVKRTKDAVYVFAVNAVKERVRARFAVDVRGAGEALWEGRAVNADGGVFEDDFAPFGVHVYRFLAPVDGLARQLRLDTFERQMVGVTTGSEFPGAKARTSYPEARTVRLDYDFTGGGNYCGVCLGPQAKGASRLTLSLRNACGTDALVSLRVLDGKDDYYMIRRPYAATNGWTTQTFDFNFLRWCFGRSTRACDRSVMCWPLKAVDLLCEPVKKGVKGTFEVRDPVLETRASEREVRGWNGVFRPTRFGSVYQPDETIELSYRTTRLEIGRAAPSVRAVVSDWRGTEVCARTLPEGAGVLRLASTDLGNRFGAFKVAFVGRNADGSTFGCGQTWFARLTGPNPKPVRWIGTGAHGWPADVRRYDLMAAAGIGTLRNDAEWSRCERSRGVYVEPAEHFVANVQALKARGISLNICLCHNNQTVYPDDPFNPEAYANLAAWFARTHPQIDVFELFNEPSNQFYKHYGSKENAWFKKLHECTRRAAEQIRSARPDATVVVCAECEMRSLFRELEMGIAQKGECVSFHPYILNTDDPRPENFPYFWRDGGRAIREAMMAHGGADRMRITEFGWSTYGIQEHAPAESWHHFGLYTGVTYEGQARYLVRAYLLARSAGVESAVQYDFQNDGPGRNDAEHNFGLVFEDCTPKPSFAAIAFMARLLGEAKPFGDCGGRPDRCRVLGFTRPDGGRVYALWALAGTEQVGLPADALGGTLYDLMGNARRLDPAEKSLSLTENVQYILKEKK